MQGIKKKIHEIRLQGIQEIQELGAGDTEDTGYTRGTGNAGIQGLLQGI